jgi:hypothetical protein
MLCFGTGYTSKALTKDEWNQFGALGVVDPVNDYPLINIFFHASESALLQSFREELGEDNFYTFNKSMYDGANLVGELPSTQIDDATPENFQRLKHFAKAIIEENRNQLDDVCDMLVRNYDAKQRQAKDEDGVFNILRKSIFGD